MPAAVSNSFDALSNHSGEFSPTRPSFENIDGGAHDDMLVDAPEPGSDDIPRYTTSQKGKQKMARTRSASEASLSPPPPANRPFTSGGAEDDDEPVLEEGQNVHYPPYNIMQNDEDIVMSSNEQTNNGGFMMDARKAHAKEQTLNSTHSDFQLALALQEEEANSLLANNGQATATAAERTFASVVRNDAGAAGSSRGPAPPAAASLPPASRSTATPRAANVPGGGGERHGNRQTPAPQNKSPASALYEYKGGVTKDDLLVAEKDGLAVHYWPPSFPHPEGPTFNTLTLFLSDENRAGWRNLKGYILIAYPADIAHTDVDELVYTIRLVCALALKNPKAVKVIPADRNGDYQAPVALIVCATREYYLWLRDQMVINNTRHPFFAISRSHPPARITHSVTGAAWENDEESKDMLEKMFRDEALRSQALGAFAEAHHDAVDKSVKDFHKNLADSITASPLDVFKKGTQTPTVYWRIKCARVTRDEEAVKELNRLVKNLPVKHEVYGTPQPIQALKCGMCGDLTHMLGKCTIAGHPAWLGERPKTASSSKNAPEPAVEEDETLPNGNMRTAAAKIKDAAANKGGKGDKNEKKKGKK